MKPGRGRTLVAAGLAALAVAAFQAGGCSTGGKATTTAAGTSTVTTGPVSTGTTALASTSTTVTPPPTTSGGAGAFTVSLPLATIPQPSSYPEPKPVDLSTVPNLDKVTLGSAQKAKLAAQGFVATSTPADAQGTPAWKFWQVYEDARYRGLPVLVTTDSMLNAFHNVFDMLIQQLEESSLMEHAVAMSEGLYNASSAQWNEATTPAAKEATLANMAYFAVALSLLKGDGTYGGEVVRDRVDAELQLVDKAGGQETSPILGYIEDYSQYKPRGHYTRSDLLKRYFRGMMWYGHTAFFVNPKKPDVSEALARRLTRQAALIATALTGDTEQAWRAIYEPTTFLVGEADDLTAADIRPALATAFGSQAPAPDALTEDARIDALRAELNKLPAPKILSHLSFGAGSQEEAERSFRLMGQRYIPDSYAFQQLVWRHVGTTENMRLFPMGLDAMAVLGSPLAYQLAAVDYGQKQYANWEAQQAKVKQEFDSRSPDVWPANLYTSWLDVLRQTMSAPPAGAPDLMKTRAWALKSLNSALGSWTELRHDTILYAKQSVIAEGGGDEMPTTVGYVEPYPTFYAQLGNLVRSTSAGLDSFGLLTLDFRGKLDGMANLCDTLKTIADKELAGQALTENERAAVHGYGKTLEWLQNFESGQGQTLSPGAEKSPVVADVHTDLAVTGKALEEGTGYPLALYAVLSVDGRPQLLVGACYEYYEFLVPMDKRMTDEEWQNALDSGQAPQRPPWTNSFIVR
jgi:hypothetical protein